MATWLLANVGGRWRRQAASAQVKQHLLIASIVVKMSGLICGIVIENHNFLWENLLYMAIYQRVQEEIRIDYPKLMGLCGRFP